MFYTEPTATLEQFLQLAKLMSFDELKQLVQFRKKKYDIPTGSMADPESIKQELIMLNNRYLANLNKTKKKSDAAQVVPLNEPVQTQNLTPIVVTPINKPIEESTPKVDLSPPEVPNIQEEQTLQEYPPLPVDLSPPIQEEQTDPADLNPPEVPNIQEEQTEPVTPVTELPKEVSTSTSLPNSVSATEELKAPADVVPKPLPPLEGNSVRVNVIIKKGAFTRSVTPQPDKPKEPLNKVDLVPLDTIPEPDGIEFSVEEPDFGIQLDDIIEDGDTKS
jgi:hypothetical protein